MTSTVGQYCINVTDLDRSVAFYEALGLTCTSRTEIPQAFEAILEHASQGYGGKMQLAQQKEPAEPFDLGTGLWKLYVNTPDIAGTHAAALQAGAAESMAPMRLDQWPVSVSFVHDPDGYLVEFVERYPWSAEAPTDGPWVGQYCVNVTDIEATIAFYEAAGLECTSRTEIPQAFEAILEAPGSGGKLQLAQQKDQDGPIRMGSLWKLYVHTDDCAGLHARLISAGYRSTMEPLHLEQWDTSIAFVADPDDYQIELVQHHGR
ncbi:MAG: VOC family protein [Aquihabitans sp.]